MMYRIYCDCLSSGVECTRSSRWRKSESGELREGTVRQSHAASCEGLGVHGKALLLIRVTTISRDISVAAFIFSVCFQFFNLFSIDAVTHVIKLMNLVFTAFSTAHWDVMDFPFIRKVGSQFLFTIISFLTSFYSVVSLPSFRSCHVQSCQKTFPGLGSTDSTRIQDVYCSCQPTILHLPTISNPMHDIWVISNEMILSLGSVAQQKLLDIYNHSWDTGTFPTSWKESIIIPILKKGQDRHSKTSYRPVSLLSCLGKIMERMVNRRLQHHLEKIGLLSPSQSGFRKNRSTEDQATLLTQDIENGF